MPDDLDIIQSTHTCIYQLIGENMVICISLLGKRCSTNCLYPSSSYRHSSTNQIRDRSRPNEQPSEKCWWSAPGTSQKNSCKRQSLLLPQAQDVRQLHVFIQSASTIQNILRGESKKAGKKQVHALCTTSTQVAKNAPLCPEKTLRRYTNWQPLHKQQRWPPTSLWGLGEIRSGAPPPPSILDELMRCTSVWGRISCKLFSTLQAGSGVCCRGSNPTRWMWPQDQKKWPMVGGAT